MKKLIVVAALFMVLMASQVMADTFVVDQGVTFNSEPRLPQMADMDESHIEPTNTGFSDIHYVVAASSGIVGGLIILGSVLAGKNYCQPLAFIGGGLFGTSACLGFGL